MLPRALPCRMRYSGSAAPTMVSCGQGTVVDGCSRLPPFLGCTNAIPLQSHRPHPMVISATPHGHKIDKKDVRRRHGQQGVQADCTGIIQRRSTHTSQAPAQQRQLVKSEHFLGKGPGTNNKWLGGMVGGFWNTEGPGPAEEQCLLSLAVLP